MPLSKLGPVERRVSRAERSVPPASAKGDLAMRFMIIVNATPDSEAAVMPPESLLAEMGAYHEELGPAAVRTRRSTVARARLR